MTDIPRGPGGDGSPQLDLDAIEAKLTEFLLHNDHAGMLSGSTFLVFREVRRLQQENEQLRDASTLPQLLGLADDDEVVRAFTGHIAALSAQAAEIVALRGRVEELTALLDGWHKEQHPGATFDACPHHLCQAAQRALLAKVVPEKETP